MDKSTQIDTFSRFSRVSRETIRSLIKYEESLINANKNLNLIGKSTIDNIWIRHFLDSAQLIDFIDKNQKSLIDLGSGAGFPGLVLAILAKDRKISLKVQLLEKSPKKIKFLTNLIHELNLDVEIFNKNILDAGCKIKQDLIVARALFTFGLVGLHVAGVLSTLGLVALHVAWVFFNLGQGIVYFWLGWPTFG